MDKAMTLLNIRRIKAVGIELSSAEHLVIEGQDSSPKLCSINVSISVVECMCNYSVCALCFSVRNMLAYWMKYINFFQTKVKVEISNPHI